MAKEFFTADWFPYYHERFEASDRVALMSCTVEGAYHRAIRWVWRERSMSPDAAVFAGRFKCTEKVAAKVLATFVVDPDDPKRVVHPVVEEIRAEQEQKFLNKRKGGIASRKKTKKGVSVNDANKDTSSTTQFCSNRTPTRIENREDSSYEESIKPESVPHACEMFVGTATAELRKRMDVKTLPAKLDWQRQAEWAFENGFTVDQMLECYDLLTKQHWRDGPVKPKHLAENLPNLGKLRKEIEKQGASGNGTGRPRSEREKSAERNRNGRAAIAELRRVGEQEREQERAGQGLLGGGDGDHSQVRQPG